MKICWNCGYRNYEVGEKCEGCYVKLSEKGICKPDTLIDPFTGVTKPPFIDYGHDDWYYK